MNKKDFAVIYERFKSSGLSISHFCENEGYSKSSFYYWRKKYLSKDSFQDLAPIAISREFKPHPLERPIAKFNQESTTFYNGEADKLTIDIKHPNGMEIRLTGDINPLLLSSIINQL